MILFVCSSIYQLMNALLIALENEEIIADIILFKLSSDTIDIKKLKQTHIFRDVYYWEGQIATLFKEASSRVTYIKQKFIKIPMYLSPKQLMTTIPNNNKNYSHIFIAYNDYPSQLIYFYFKKKSKAELSLYEDGTFTYECFETKPTFARLLYSRLFFGGFLLDECKNVYVHKIEAVRLGCRKNILIHPIKRNIDKIEEIFQTIVVDNGFKTARIKERIILFDQNLEYENIIQAQKRLAYKLTQTFSRSNVCVKLHPGTGKIVYDDNVKVNTSKIPFEVFINTSISNESILISVFSTACFNPKWMFDFEPYVILTYKVVQLDSVDYFDKQYYEVVNRLKHSYRNPDKIFIPENEEEIIEFIKKLL